MPAQADRLSAWLRSWQSRPEARGRAGTAEAVDAFVRSGATAPSSRLSTSNGPRTGHNAPWRNETPRNDGSQATKRKAILDELRLRGDYCAGASRCPASTAGTAERRAAIAPTGQAVKRATTQFRSRRGLHAASGRHPLGTRRTARTSPAVRAHDADEAGVEELAREPRRRTAPGHARPAARDWISYAGLPRARIGQARDRLASSRPSCRARCWRHGISRSDWASPFRMTLPTMPLRSDLPDVEKFYELLAREYTFAHAETRFQ